MNHDTNLPARRRLKAWLFTLLLVLLVEVLAWCAVDRTRPEQQGLRFYHPGVEPTFMESVIHWQTRRALDLPLDADVIFLGDSAALMGLIPEQMEREIHRDIENFGLVQVIGVSGHVDLLLRYLETHARPELLVYYFSDGTLSQPLDDPKEQGVRDAYHDWLGVSERPVDAWPTTRLRARVRLLWSAGWYEDTPQDQGVREFIHRHQGYVRETREEGALEEVPVGLNPEVAEHLLRLFEVTETWAIPLYLVHAPMPERFDRPDNRRRHELNEAALTELADGRRGVHLLRPFATYAPTEFFRDYEHLTLEGAQINSARMARWLSSVLGD